MKTLALLLLLVFAADASAFGGRLWLAVKMRPGYLMMRLR